MNYDTTPIWLLAIIAAIALIALVAFAMHAERHPDRFAGNLPRKRVRKQPKAWAKRNFFS